MIPGLGTLWVPLLSESDEEKKSCLRTLVHIQCVVTLKYFKFPKNSLKKNRIPINLMWLPFQEGDDELRQRWGAPDTEKNIITSDGNIRKGATNIVKT